ncbi:hypothetical protein [Brevundimonas sp.]|uniref:hypothetical protein n=1 Tax=Brevundimonas sp. TaxID=1871086 RepID=UPI0035B1833F
MKIIITPAILEALKAVDAGNEPRLEQAGQWIVTTEGGFLTLELPNARPGLGDPG